MTLKGKLSIHRTSSNMGPDTVTIELHDEGSGIQFATARMSLETFAQGILGLSFMPVDLELRGLDRVGMLLETKRELVPAVSWNATEEEKRAALEPFETDGWRGRAGDLTNHHNAVRNEHGEFRNVHFSRHVPHQGAA